MDCSNAYIPIRKFLPVFLGQLVFSLSTQLFEFVIGLWLYHETQSIVLYSIYIFFVFMPGLLAAPLIGEIIDNYNKQTILLFGILTVFIGAFCITILCYMKLINIIGVISISAISALCSSFQYPLLSTSLIKILRKEDLKKANALFQMIFASKYILVPLIGGAFYNGIDLLLLALITNIASFSYFIVILSSKFLATERKSTYDLTKTLSCYFSNLRFSYDYIKKQNHLSTILISYASYCFIYGILEVLFVPFLISMAGASNLGLILSVGGLGMIVGAGGITLLKFETYSIEIILNCLLIQGLILCSFYLYFNITSLYVFTFLFFLFGAVSMVVNNTLWQLLIPSELQGRIFTFRNSLNLSMLCIGYICAGLMQKLSYAIISYGYLQECLSYTCESIQLVFGGLGLGIAIYSSYTIINMKFFAISKANID